MRRVAFVGGLVLGAVALECAPNDSYELAAYVEVTTVDDAPVYALTGVTAAQGVGRKQYYFQNIPATHAMHMVQLDDACNVTRTWCTDPLGDYCHGAAAWRVEDDCTGNVAFTLRCITHGDDMGFERLVYDHTCDDPSPPTPPPPEAPSPSPPWPPYAPQCAHPSAFAYLIDVSSSLLPHAATVRQILHARIDQHDLAASPLGLVTFGAEASVLAPLGTTATALHAIVDEQLSDVAFSQDTQLAVGLQAAQEMLAAASDHARIVVISDYDSNAAFDSDAVATAEAIKATGTTIVALGVGDNVLTSVMTQVASSPPDVFAAVASTALAALLFLGASACDAFPPAAPPPPPAQDVGLVAVFLVLVALTLLSAGFLAHCVRRER